MPSRRLVKEQVIFSLFAFKYPPKMFLCLFPVYCYWHGMPNNTSKSNPSTIICLKFVQNLYKSVHN